jgi:uncharacterized SAM-binding protein YcdF (DUF218 family)
VTAKTEAGNKVTSAPPSAPPDATPGVIVVLGARVFADGRPSRAMQRRMKVAIDLYRTGAAPVLLLSGGGEPVAEAEVMRQIALAAGIAESALLVESASRNTLENAMHAAALLAAHQVAAVVLVTDRWHAFRARLLFRLAGLTVCAVHSATVPARRQIAMRLSEGVKLPISLLRALLHKVGRALFG